MTGSPDDLGTHTWVERTGGLLTGAERRGLLRPLASAHVTNAVGRLSMIVGVNTGRRARVAVGRLRPPDSVLTRAAEAEARRRLTPATTSTSASGTTSRARWCRASARCATYRARSVSG